MKLKINFVDFWPDFQKNNNYFFHLLNTKYDVKIDENKPDILFFSVDFNKKKEREKYLNDKCKKIFYTGENVRPNFNFPGSIESLNYSIGKCDFAFSFDFINHPNHYRLPLWVLQIDWFKKGGYGNPEFLLEESKINNNEFINTKKDKFCCFVFNNPVPIRLQLMEKINKYKKVDGYGTPFGNWFYGEKNKYKILSKYKFSICIENSISNVGGYYTEKLFHAKTAGNIPLYWTDNKCFNDFNIKSFINLNDYKSIENFIEEIIKIDNDDILYNKIFNEPLFENNKIKDSFRPENVLKFFEEKILC